jgi:hypothetical protein
MSRNSIYFVIGQKYRTLYTKTVRFTLLSATCCWAIKAMRYFWIAMKTVVTRTRQKFFDL